MVLLVMGVEGSGKTTVGRLLAERLGWTFLEADDFHSTGNKEKMHKGIPLTDADRIPWLQAIHKELLVQTAGGKNAVLACSALKKEYRRLLTEGLQVELVYLRGSYGLIGSRLRARHGHFAGEAILKDQFATLEEPDDAIVEDVTQPPEQIVEKLLPRIRVTGTSSKT